MKRKPIVVKHKLRRNKSKPAAFIRTKVKSASDEVGNIAFWNRLKTAAAPSIPHPFLPELLALPAGFGLLGGGLGSLVDDENATARFALTAGLMGLGVALGRGAGAKFLPNATKSARGMLSGAGIGAGMLASDALLPEAGYEPVFGDNY
jgi:hypothetical protein